MSLSNDVLSYLIECRKKNRISMSFEELSNKFPNQDKDALASILWTLDSKGDIVAIGADDIPFEFIITKLDKFYK